MFRTNDTVSLIRKMLVEADRDIALLGDSGVFLYLAADFLPSAGLEKEFNVLKSACLLDGLGGRLLEKRTAAPAYQAIAAQNACERLVNHFGVTSEAASFAVNALILTLGWRPLPEYFDGNMPIQTEQEAAPSVPSAINDNTEQLDEKQSCFLMIISNVISLVEDIRTTPADEYARLPYYFSEIRRYPKYFREMYADIYYDPNRWDTPSVHDLLSRLHEDYTRINPGFPDYCTVRNISSMTPAHDKLGLLVAHLSGYLEGMLKAYDESSGPQSQKKTNSEFGDF